MHKIKNIIIAVLLVAGISWSAFAEDVSFESRVDSNQLPLGSSTHLVLTVRGVDKVDAITLPTIDGFDARYIGPQTEMSFINGVQSSSKSFIYALFPVKTGQWNIPAFSITIDDKEYRTEPITIEVIDQATTSAVATDKTSGSPSAISLQDKIMLVLATPKTDVYLHEQIPLTIKLLYNGVTVGEIQYPSFDLTGFTKEDFEQPQQSQQVINGLGYNTVVFKTYISPTRTGALMIGPAKLEASLVYQSADQSNPRSLFGSDIFDSFFTTYEKRPVTVTSQPITLNVLPLPEEGTPQDFSGAVGQFDFTVTVSPAEVKVGDPITLRMKVTGNGNLKSIVMPALDDKKFKTYDPQIKDEGNTKILEQVIIPTSASVKDVPAFRFSYFDTQEKIYKVIIQGPFPVIVTTPQPGEEFKAVGFETIQPTEPLKEELGRDIVFLKEHLGVLLPLGYHVYKTVWFWALMIFYWVGWAAFLAVYILKQRLKTDARFARKFKAPRQARQGLERAQALMEQGNTKEFYSVVVKTLKDYLGNQLHIPSGGMTFATVERLLKARKIDEKIIQSIKTIFEAADMVRFASVNLDEGNMPKTFESLKTIIDHLERSL